MAGYGRICRRRPGGIVVQWPSGGYYTSITNAIVCVSYCFYAYAKTVGAVKDNTGFAVGCPTTTTTAAPTSSSAAPTSSSAAPTSSSSSPCWVAQTVYGMDSPKWVLFRDWLFGPDVDKPNLDTWLQRTYMAHGQAFAKFISTRSNIRWLVRKMMDTVIK